MINVQLMTMSSCHLRSYICCCFILLTLFVTAAATELYPPSWNEDCASEVNKSTVNIKCTLNGDDSLYFNLTDLNNYAENKTMTYSLNIECVNRGGLNMRLPMKIYNLTHLTVKGCRLYEFLNDWNNEDLANIEDSIEYLEIRDCTTVNSMQFIIDSFKAFDNFSQEWFCGHDKTIRKSVWRNISIDITDVDNNDTVNVPWVFEYDNQNEILMDKYNPYCKFEQLELLEETQYDAMHKDNLLAVTKTQHYPKLQRLIYSSNGIREFSTNANFAKFGKLEYIDFSRNIIREVKLTGLKSYLANPVRDLILNVSYNNITTFTAEDLTNWATNSTGDRHVFVDIRGNPINCECLQKRMIQLVQDREKTFFVGHLKKYQYIQSMTCASPASARGIPLSLVTEEEMGCPQHNDLTVHLIVLAIMAIVCIVLMACVFKWRREIKIILFIRFNILLPWDKDDGSNDKKYDAFISYSSKDGDWVVNYLHKMLEKPTDSSVQFKCCIHERDFIGGVSILQNITQSIENSRHTVIVLSNNFLKNVWTMAEFHEAYQESITNKRRHLIIIKYQDIKEEDLDPKLKRCLKTFTYLDVKDAMFLDRLRFSLAIKSRKSDTTSNSTSSIA